MIWSEFKRTFQVLKIVPTRYNLDKRWKACRINRKHIHKKTSNSRAGTGSRSCDGHRWLRRHGVLGWVVGVHRRWTLGADVISSFRSSFLVFRQGFGEKDFHFHVVLHSGNETYERKNRPRQPFYVKKAIFLDFVLKMNNLWRFKMSSQMANA